MQDKIIKKLEDHDAQHAGIAEKLEEHDAIFVRISERFDEVDKKFDVVRKDIKESEDRIMTSLDGIAGQLQRMDDERYATIARCDRIEEKHDKDIAKLRKACKVA